MGGLLLRFEREREKEREKIFVELFIGGKKVFVVERENNCVYFFCIFLSSFLSCATQKNSLTLFEDTKDDDDDFDDFDDGAYCEERPSPKEGKDSANQSRWCSRFFFCEEVFSVSKAERFKRVRF